MQKEQEISQDIAKYTDFILITILLLFVVHLETDLGIAAISLLLREANNLVWFCHAIATLLCQVLH